MPTFTRKLTGPDSGCTNSRSSCSTVSERNRTHQRLCRASNQSSEGPTGALERVFLCYDVESAEAMLPQVAASWDVAARHVSRVA